MFLKDLKQMYKADEYVHRMEMTYYDTFCRKWLLYQVLVEKQFEEHDIFTLLPCHCHVTEYGGDQINI